MKIATRLKLLTGVLSAVLLAVGAVGLIGIRQSNEALRSVYEDRLVSVGQLQVINAAMLRARLAISNTLLDPTPDNLALVQTELNASLAAAAKEWSDFQKHQLGPDETARAKSFTAAREKFVQDGLMPAMAAMDATEFFKARKVVNGPILELFEPVRAQGNALMQLQLAAAKADYEAAQTRYATIRNIALLASAGGVGFAVWFGFLLRRGITRSLRQAMDAAHAVAAGELSYKIEVRGRDEVGQLLEAFATMQGSLATVVSKVRENSRSVALASAEIAQGNLYLSERTELQAAALQRTAGTMGQLGNMVRVNDEHSREANQLAKDASAVAAQGGRVVGEVVGTMKDISDSSRRITDIIGVIDGIAFQTNILALNAAVEAARAGDQGRGFAVVASEVRSLAKRSADAAKEIKNLIHRSVEQVEKGTLLVNEAGRTMEGIVGSIGRVTSIVSGISAASAQQSSGVAEVGESVSEMDQATQQNAALVEQSAAAAQSLQVQAQQLVAAVAVFKLEDETAEAV